MRLFTIFRRRSPPAGDLLLVFGGVAFIVHLWALFNLFYILPGWVLRLDIGELVGAISYVLAFSLLESLLVGTGLGLAALVFPQKWLRQQFVSRAMNLFLLTTVFATGFQYSYARLAAERALLVGVVALYLVLAAALLFFARRLTPLEKAWRKILQKTIVPSAFYLLLDLLALLVIAYRNII